MKKASTSNEQVFHYAKKEYGINSIRNALDKGIITAEDAELIKGFVTETRLKDNIGIKRANKITFTLVNWRRFIGPYTANNFEQIVDGIDALKSGKSQRGKPFQQNTIRDYILFLKRFYTWMIENEYSKIDSRKIEKIRAPANAPKKLLPDDILTEGEIRALIDACKSPRDRALVAILYESGCRVGEVGKLTWNRLRFDKYGVGLIVDDTKTSKQRYVKLVMSLPYLAAWRGAYPFAPEGDALVFITNRKSPMQYSTITRILEGLLSRAGISKHVTPHLFRHTRVTHLINQGMSESVIKLMMWGNINTNMFRTYAHLSSKNIETEVMRHYGIVCEKSESHGELQPEICSQCSTINPPGALFCSTCGLALSEEIALTLREMEEELRRDPLYQQCLAQMSLAAA